MTAGPRARTLSLFLNYSCNASCDFCFNPAQPSPEELRGMDTTLAAAALLRAYRLGCRAVSFIGGEATLRADLLKLVAASRRVGFEEIRLVTNGLLLAEPGRARALAAAGLGRAEVSLHAHVPSVHDELLGVPGAFERAAAALEALREAGVAVGVNTVVNRLNHRLLPEMAEDFLGRGLRRFSFFGLRYIGHMGLPGRAERLAVRASEAVPYLRAAVGLIRREAGPGGVCLGDLTPCLLPEFADLMTDWRRGGDADLLAHPDGRLEESAPVCGDGKRQVGACADCRFAGDCLGVEETYLARFGEGEFRPVLLEAPREV